MITGGTGSFGNAVLRRFLRTDIAEIRIFSRDEKKQDDMRHEYQAEYPDVAHKIKFYIGDVRSLESVRSAMLSEISQRFSRWAERAHGVFCRLDRDRFCFVRGAVSGGV